MRRLPLALSIVAARAVAHPRLSLTRLAAELINAHVGLDAFAGDDLATNLRAVFSWSYEALRAHRMLDHYLHTATAAAQMIYPERVTLPDTYPGTTPEEVSDERQALAWFVAERHVLLGAVDRAFAEGFDRHVGELADAMWTASRDMDTGTTWPSSRTSRWAPP